MRFRGYRINTASAFVAEASSEDHRRNLQHHAGVVEWYLTLQAQHDAGQNARVTGVVIDLVPSEVGAKTFYDGNTMHVCVPTQIAKLTGINPDQPTYAALIELVQRGMLQLPRDIGADFGKHALALNDFLLGTFLVEATVAERRPQGSDVRFRIQAHMQRTGLRIFFETHSDDGRLYQELIQLSQPDYLWYLKGVFPKILFDGETVTVPKPLVAPNERRHRAIMDGTYSAKDFPDNGRYLWKRALKDILEQG